MTHTTVPGITLLGLGPGDPQLLTRQAWEVLEHAGEVYLRTRQHPAAAGLPAGLAIHSFDELREHGDTVEAAYARIVERVLELGRRPQGVIYAVPGHPLVAEATGLEIARRAKQEGLPCRVVAGVSFLEPALTALGVDPFPRLALADALELAAAHTPPFPTSAPALVAQIHSPAVAAGVKTVLLTLYPGEHPVRLVHAAGTPHELVEDLPLETVERSPHTGPLTCLYVPPLGAGTAFEDFLEIIAHLRAPNGCPWDREQTHLSLRTNLLEEAYEVLTALDAGSPEAMREEFGDLLLQIVLHAQIASEYGEFNIAGVLQGIYAKIVHRHPHVFGDADLKDAQSVLVSWEKIKAAERAAVGRAEASLMDGVARALPALTQAEEIQRRAARVGFDWPEIQGVQDKVDEEMNELRAAATPEERSAELGDLLFAVVNLARWYEVDAESALRGANNRFRQRFGRIEQAAREQGRSVADLSLDEMEAVWQLAKRSSPN